MAPVYYSKVNITTVTILLETILYSMTLCAYCLLSPQIPMQTDSESNSVELDTLEEWSPQLPTSITSECHSVVADSLNSPALSYLSDCADINPAGKT